MLSAVSGGQQGTVGPDGQTVLQVLEPDIQQRRLACKVFELFVPALAAIAAGEDLCVVSHRPAVLFVDKIDGGQQLASRHAGLDPALALIIGIKNMAVIADCDQSSPCVGDVQQQAASGFR